MTYVTSKNEVILAVGQTADAETCGSCKWFKRYDDYGMKEINNEQTSQVLGLQDREYQRMGDCTFKLPPKIMKRYVHREYDEDGQPDRVPDTDYCDLYKHSGFTYIVSRRVKP